jgi:hypothetical protein
MTPAVGQVVLRRRSAVSVITPLANAAGIPAIFDACLATGPFYTGGALYQSYAAMLTALGASSSGVTASLGGYVDARSSSVLTNGTFDTVTTGWTAQASGAIAIVSGEMQFTVNVSGDAFSQTVTGYNGRAFAFTGTGRRGTNVSNSPMLAATTQNAALGGNQSFGTAATASNTTSTVYISSGAGGGTYYGVRGATGFGTTLWDDFTAKEAMPMPGWAAPAVASGDAAPQWSVVIDAVAPASLPAGANVQVLWQADANQERDRARLQIDSSGNIKLLITNNNAATATLTAGAVIAGASFKVAAGVCPGTNAVDSGFAVSLDGANCAVQSTVAASPGVSHMRIGRDVAGSNIWAGTFNRITVVKDRQTVDWLEAQTAPFTAIWGEGDSYFDGAGGVALKDLLETSLGVKVINSAVGGSTLANIRDRITARDYLRTRKLVIWDGSANSRVSQAADIAIYQQIFDWKANSSIVIIPSLAVPNPGVASSASPSAYAAELAAETAALISTFGAAHVFNALPVLQALSTGSADDLNDLAAGLVPRSAMLDQTDGQVHLSLAAMTAVAGDSSLLAKIAAL